MCKYFVEKKKNSHSVIVRLLQAKAIGRLLFDQVCKQLNLLEADYFGLEYQDATTKVGNFIYVDDRNFLNGVVNLKKFSLRRGYDAIFLSVLVGFRKTVTSSGGLIFGRTVAEVLR